MVFGLAFSASMVLGAAGDGGPDKGLSRPTHSSLRLHGPIGKLVDGVVKNWLVPLPDANPGILDMFRRRDQSPPLNLLPWSGEFAGKYLTGATEVLRLTGDPTLRARLDRFVVDLVQCQDADGYLGPFAKADRFARTAPNVWGTGGDTWDAWGHYHAMLGLLAWNDLTGDPKALGAAKRIGDLMCATFFGDKPPVSAEGSPEMNQAIVHSMALLYDKTKEQRYLDFAQKVVADFAHPTAGDYLRAALAGEEFHQTPANGPRWESLHSILGLVELHRQTGHADYRRAFEHHWWSIVKTDRHNNGGFTSGERAQGNPYHPGAIETCCTVAWLALSVEMLKLTANPVVADELELSTLNQVVGLLAKDGSWCTYNTPMEGVRIPSTEDIAFQIRPGTEGLNCCSVNAARGLGLISEWALLQRGSELFLNGYGPSDMAAEVAGSKVALSQKTTYPKDGTIEIVVGIDRPSRFALNLRIPHWSTSTQAALNGDKLDAKPGTYLRIDRQWKGGDRIVLQLDMAPRVWVGQRERRDQVSIYRGPVLFAHEADAEPVRMQGKWERGFEVWVSDDDGAYAELAFDGDAVAFEALRYDDAGILRILVDGKEVDRLDLYGPVRGQPVAWRRNGLGSGRHVVRFERTGEMNPASSGTWANFVAIRPIAALPMVKPEQIRSAVFRASSEGVGFLEIETDSGPLVLRDYGSAGQNRRPYTTWIPCRDRIGVPFTPDNPSRSSKLPELSGT